MQIRTCTYVYMYMYILCTLYNTVYNVLIYNVINILIYMWRVYTYSLNTAGMTSDAKKGKGRQHSTTHPKQSDSNPQHLHSR